MKSIEELLPYRSERDYMLTVGGTQVYPLNARPEEISVSDMIHALSHLCRYGGHSEFFYSVAQHSLYVTEILKGMGESPLVQFYGLWHDGTEAYLTDMPRPIKQHLRSYTQIENRLHDIIWEALGVRKPMKKEWRKVKKADDLVLYHEAKFVQPKGDWWKEHHVDLGFEVIERPSSEIRKEFLAKHEELSRILFF